MTEVKIPVEADEKRASELVREHLEIGDEVLVRNQETAAGQRIEERGEVTGFEPGYLELDGQPLTAKSVRYDDLHVITKIEDE